MKTLPLNQLLHELQKHIENLSVAQLQEVIYSVAQNIPANKRQDFLDIVRHALVKNETASKHGAIKPEITPEDLFNSIEEFRERMEHGHFFDEEENYRAYDRDEYRYYRRGYDDYMEEEPDFSTEYYVIEMENMLGYAEYFCAKGDFSTAYEAYRRLFEIMENDDEAGSNDYFIYGFSFEEAIFKSILGFTHEKKYIPAIISLLFLSVAQKKEAQIINDLMNCYCFNNEKEKYSNLEELVAGKVIQENKPTGKTLEAFGTTEKIAVNRVRHILANKLRGGYESACLLLTACAEAKEIHNQSGNQLITRIDTEFKRFSAFRRELKALTQRSRYLTTVR